MRGNLRAHSLIKRRQTNARPPSLRFGRGGTGRQTGRQPLCVDPVRRRAVLAGRLRAEPLSLWSPGPTPAGPLCVFRSAGERSSIACIANKGVCPSVYWGSLTGERFQGLLDTRTRPSAHLQRRAVQKPSRSQDARQHTKRWASSVLRHFSKPLCDGSRSWHGSTAVLSRVLQLQQHLLLPLHPRSRPGPFRRWPLARTRLAAPCAFRVCGMPVACLCLCTLPSLGRDG